MPADFISPHYQIYNKVFSELLGLGYEIYDYLPNEEAGLPFVYIGEQFNVDTANKSTVTGSFQQTLHIYAGVRQRKQVYEMMNSIKFVMRKIIKTDDFNISVRGVNDQLLLDNSGTTDLLHGIVEIEFKFN